MDAKTAAVAAVLAGHSAASMLDPEAFAPFLLSAADSGCQALEDALGPLLPDPSVAPALAVAIMAAVENPFGTLLAAPPSASCAEPAQADSITSGGSSSAKTFFDKLQTEAAAARAEAVAKRAQLQSTASASASRGGKKGQSRRRWEAVDSEAVLGATLPAVAVVAGDTEDVCRHFMAGSCLRADCPFLHDTSFVPCKFYGTAAGCAYGEACSFRHDAPPASTVAGKEPLVGSARAGESVGTDSAALAELQFDQDELAWTGSDADADAALTAAAAAVAAMSLDGTAAGVDAGDGQSPFYSAVAALARSFGLEPSVGAKPAAAACTAAPAAATPSVTVASDMSPDSFPSLGGSTPARPSAASVGKGRVWSNGSLSLSSRLALVQLKREFPAAADAAIGAAWERCARDLSAARKLLNSGPVGFTADELASAAAWVPTLAAAAAQADSAASVVTASSAGGAGASGRSASLMSSRDDAAAAARIGASLAWVETGAAVSSLYNESRAQAAAFARARNAAFDKATRAYRAGDGAAAAHFSKQGRELDAAMRAAHAAAAAAIFATRNSSRGGSSAVAAAGGARGVAGISGPPARSVLPPPVVLPGGLAYHAFDLHGLHPSEAADVAVAAIEAAQAATIASGGGAGAGQWMALLTGARHHSGKLGKGGGSVPAAVEAALESCEVRYHVVGDQGAVIAVRLAV